MPTMTISPIQQEYVTKVEFYEFARRVDGNFKIDNDNFRRIHESFIRIDRRFDGFESYIKDGFNKVFEQIDAVEGRLGKKIDALELKIDRRFESMDNRFESMDRRFDLMDKRFDALSDQIALLVKTVNSQASK